MEENSEFLKTALGKKSLKRDFWSEPPADFLGIETKSFSTKNHILCLMLKSTLNFEVTSDWKKKEELQTTLRGGSQYLQIGKCC